MELCVRDLNLVARVRVSHHSLRLSLEVPRKFRVRVRWRIEQGTVVRHELHVSEERIDVSVLLSLRLLPHLLEADRLLDDLMVARCDLLADRVPERVVYVERHCSLHNLLNDTVEHALAALFSASAGRQLQVSSSDRLLLVLQRLDESVITVSHGTGASLTGLITTAASAS